MISFFVQMIFQFVNLLAKVDFLLNSKIRLAVFTGKPYCMQKLLASSALEKARIRVKSVKL